MKTIEKDFIAMTDLAKRNSAMINAVTIDWECLKTLLPLMTKSYDELPDGLKGQCAAVLKLLDNVENNVRHLKTLVPEPQGQLVHNDN